MSSPKQLKEHFSNQSADTRRDTLISRASAIHRGSFIAPYSLYHNELDVLLEIAKEECEANPDQAGELIKKWAEIQTNRQPEQSHKDIAELVMKTHLDHKQKAFRNAITIDVNQS